MVRGLRRLRRAGCFALETLEQEIDDDVVTNTAFQTLSREISKLLARTPKREVYEVL
jgi:hypothetical protein